MNTFLPCLVAALATAQTAPASPPGSSEWPAYKGNAGLTGVSGDDSIRPPFKLAWTYRLDGGASSDAGAGVTVAGGKVFVNVSNTYSILALDAATGRFAWEYRGAAVGYLTVPTFAEGKLFLWLRQPKKSAIVVLDAATRRELRQQALKAEGADPTRAGLSVLDGKVFCSEGGEEPAVIAYDRKTGKEITKFPTLEGVLKLRPKSLSNFPQLAAMGTPLVIGDHVCFATVSGRVVLTEPDGKERWNYQLGGTGHATPVAVEGYLVVGCDDGQLYAFRQK